MPSVAVVVLDTLRYDAFERSFGWLDGVHFTRAYSTSHWTIPAHASLFTGQYPSEVGVHGRSPTLDCEEPVLAEVLAEAGMSTQLITANLQLTRYDGWDRGFSVADGEANLARTRADTFDWDAHIEATEPGLGRHLRGLLGCLRQGRGTIASLEQGLELVRRPSWDGGSRAVRRRLRQDSFDDDTFLFVNLMETHTPYHPLPGEEDPVVVLVADAFAGTVPDPERIRAAYARSVAYLADVYRDIYRELASAFDYVITLSDHGELLGEHGLWNHSIGIYPELVHVPLVVSGEGLSDQTRADVVSLLDVHRTIADLAGVEVDSRGRNLLKPLQPVDQLIESHGLLPFHEAQFDRKDVPREAIEAHRRPLNGFMSSNGAYCYETHTEGFQVVGDPPVPEPERHLQALVAELDKRTVTDVDDDVSAEVRARLKELGYA